VTIYLRPSLCVGLFFIFSGCATYQSSVSEGRRFLQQRQFEAALSKLKPLADKDDGDRLIHLLDYGTALQMAGQIPESNKVFLFADKFAESQDYHSVSRVTGSMLLNEEMVQYKGDTFEKVFINAFLALNYLELNQLDDALVETRRMNEKYKKLRGEDKKSFELNPFAKYLSALIWEADQKWDDAYIAYAETYALDQTIQTIKSDLIRTAKMSRRMDEYKKWKAAFPEVVEVPSWSDRSFGELVVIYQQGWGPRKDFAPHDRRVPILRPVSSVTQMAELEIQNLGKFQSEFVYDTERAAIKTLQDDAAALLARRLAAFAAKQVVSDQIRQKNELLGFLSNVAMHVSERADLRQWSTLPQTIRLIKVPLKAGSYQISIQGLSGSGAPTSDRLESRTVVVKAGRKVFINWRSLN
jgi:hypothetical protein